MFFGSVQEAPPDPVFGLAGAFKADKRTEKVDLMVGIYKDAALRAELLPSVRKAQEWVGDLMADYLPMDGLREMVELLGPVVFGEGWDEGRIYGAHVAGGTGALRAGMEFLAQEVGKAVYLSNPTWPNHKLIVERAGCKAEMYPYYGKRGFDFEAMVGALERLAEKSVVLLHACCHNPTGSDPTAQQWKEISLLMRERELVPFFDCAYQGLGEGLEKDAEAVRVFLKDGHEMLVAYSCSKNFSMYCQRVGVLFVVGENGIVKQRVGSQVKRVVRAMYSNPPAHGALIVAEVLKRPDLRKMWEKDLAEIRQRLKVMREKFVQKTGFEYLRKSQGMFCFLDLNKEKAKELRDRFGVYILDNGRISLPGLNAKNIDYVVSSILAVSEK